jgi:hypothetical protein
MNRVEGSTNTAQTICASSGYHDLLPVSDTNGAAQGSTGPIQQDASAAARTATGAAPAGNGSTDLAGPDRQSFDVYFTCDPAQAEIDDRKPGLFSALEAWMRNRSCGEARQMLPTQAIAPPAGAIDPHT